MSLLNRLPVLNDPYVRRLLSYLPPYKKYIAGAVCCMILGAGTSSLIAILLGKLTDMGFYEHNPIIVWLTPLGLIGISILHGGTHFLSSYLLQKVSQSVLVKVRNLMFSRVITWSSQTYQHYMSGRVVSKFVNEASNALGSAAEILTTIVRDSLQIVALACILIYHNWLLTLVTLVVAPLLAMVLKWVSRRMKKLTTGQQNALGEMTVAIQEAYEGQRVVKIYNGYEYERSRFNAINERLKKILIHRQAVASAGTPLTQLVTMMGVSVVVVFALIQAQTGALTMGEFTTYLSAMLLMMPPIRHLSALNGSIAQMSAASESIFKLIDEPSEEDKGTKQLERATGAVSFKHVSHTYEGSDKPAVEDFTLDVKPGEMIALVGSSGSGKTTLINLIPRFWTMTSGDILFDGISQKDLTLESLRKQISLVSQDVILFDDTIGNNIAYGVRDKVTEEDIRKAAEAAYLLPFIESLPDGFNTRVGEAGAKLSGGQRQRISIARALLKNAPILLLDEATSALDTESEKYIQASLDKLMVGRTSFVVAHRLSTIEGADRIVVMKNGRIVEIGNHRELLERNGVYANLYRIQFSEKAH
ncbi:MAG TPA: lipid A export permease/ATP-binding protein MsbA [Candidatus Aphodousia gallistercoris]|nr:lipid A export permease/ATP-binding protein MsbA [Candidatus Aphodousia gallistercoris]